MGEKSAECDSHIVPKCVLKCLCRWKSEVNDYEEFVPERDYMFRTDIGDAVTAGKCTSGFKKLLCKGCEKRFKHVDEHALTFWEKLHKNWPKGCHIMHIPKKVSSNVKKDYVNKRKRMMEEVDITKNVSERVFIRKKDDDDSDLWAMNVTKIVLFSVMARAMCMHVSLHCNHNLNSAVKTFMKEKGIACKETMNELVRIGFMYDHLPHNETFRYRVEFPFICALKIGRKSTRIMTVCAQVPPFFFLIPEQNDDIRTICTLRKYLSKIACAVNEKLNTELERFYKEYRGCNFLQWHQRSRSLNPLLIFKYLVGKEPLDVHISSRRHSI